MALDCLPQLSQSSERDMAMHCRYLVVVEKDAVFQRLVDDNFAELADCILVTAKGMPDMATRAFVHALLQAVPRLTAVACALAS